MTTPTNTPQPEKWVCPICAGSGRVSVRFRYNPGSQARTKSERPWIGPVPCGACGGRGKYRRNETTAEFRLMDPYGKEQRRIIPGILVETRVQNAVDARRLGRDGVWGQRRVSDGQQANIKGDGVRWPTTV